AARPRRGRISERLAAVDGAGLAGARGFRVEGVFSGGVRGRGAECVSAVDGILKGRRGRLGRPDARGGALRLAQKVARASRGQTPKVVRLFAPRQRCKFQQRRRGAPRAGPRLAAGRDPGFGRRNAFLEVAAVAPRRDVARLRVGLRLEGRGEQDDPVSAGPRRGAAAGSRRPSFESLSQRRLNRLRAFQRAPSSETAADTLAPSSSCLHGAGRNGPLTVPSVGPSRARKSLLQRPEAPTGSEGPRWTAVGFEETALAAPPLVA
ncbi:hypothetical protein M885DRAFT_588786, partial [Pelagophyceae sp. CCMP2097]